MSETIAEALGVTNGSANPGDGNEVGGGPTHKEMLALDPIDSEDIGKDTVAPDVTDSWADYEYSRKVAQNNLEQAQIVLQSGVEYVNASPSSRAYEVLGNLIKIVNDCSTQLLDIQKKMKDVSKPTPEPKSTGLVVPDADGGGGKTHVENQTNILIGNPTDALKYLEGLRAQGAVEGTAEVIPDGD